MVSHPLPITPLRQIFEKESAPPPPPGLSCSEVFRGLRGANRRILSLAFQTKFALTWCIARRKRAVWFPRRINNDFGPSDFTSVGSFHRTKHPMTAESREVQAIFERWTLYEKVIRLNYMRHQEMIRVIQQAVEQIGRPLRVLDLGCGDGWMASQGLSQSSVESYLGIDLSESALRQAEQNLRPLGENVDLRQGNFREVMESHPGMTPNLVLTSYSLHHFSGSELRWIVQRIGETLDSDHGVFLWIDLKCEADETRGEYMSRFHDHLLPEWNALTTEQRDEVIDHMLQSDFPLTLREQHSVASDAGLHKPSCFYQDDYYAAHTYRRAISP